MRNALLMMTLLRKTLLRLTKASLGSAFEGWYLAAAESQRLQQRAVRRALEAHPNFDDLFEMWQSTASNGDGYAFHATLPAVDGF